MAPDAPFHARRPMIAQVLPDAWKVVAHLYAHGLEALTRADAGELEKLRRGDGSGRNDHLALSPRLALKALGLVAHTHAARALQDEVQGQGVGLDGEVGPRSGRVQIASRRAHAPTATDRGLRHGDA